MDKQNHVIELFSKNKKSDLVKYCRDITITKHEFAETVMFSELIGYYHNIRTIEYIPDHLKINKKEDFFNKSRNKKSLTEEDQKFFKKISSIFQQRRYIISHLFISKDKWHIFYFDFHDIDITNNHWKNGSHIHFVNYLWSNLNCKEVWESLGKRTNKSYGIHIRWNNERDIYQNKK